MPSPHARPLTAPPADTGHPPADDTAPDSPAADDPAVGDQAGDPVPGTTAGGVAGGPPADGIDGAEREQRFAEGLRTLRVGGGSLALGERTLMILGGIIAPLGLVVILLGWYGAARSAQLFDQVPYLISGGLFGLGLVVLGSFSYFAHWLTELVKEQRTQSAAVVEAIRALQDHLDRGDRPAGSSAPASNGASAVDPAAEATGWVATPHGTLAHRPDCVVVAGKPAVRPVPADQATARCQLCTPTPARQ